MEQIGETITNLFGKKKPIAVLNSERAAIVHDFLEFLNDERLLSNGRNYAKARVLNPKLTKDEFRKTKEYMKPLSASFVAFKMSHLSIPDMHYLWSVCKQGKSFSKTWWWSLKPKPEDSVRVIHRRG